jgi:hypothetical protein
LAVRRVIETDDAGVRLFAFAFTVNITVVPEEEAVPEVEEGVSQLGTLDIE